MERVMLVEQLDRRGHLVSRTRIAQLPATIGRGYGCDVIVDDRHADALHARLSVDEAGGFVVEDLGSVNGLWDAAGRRATRCEVAPGGTVRVGQTTLRLVTPEVAVPPAEPEQLQVGGWRRIAARPRSLALLAAGTLLLLAADTASLQVDGDGAADTAGLLIAIVAAVALWAGAWSAGARLAGRPPRFLAHTCVAWIAILLMSAPDMVLGFATAAFPDAMVLDVIGWVVALGVSLWALAAHLELVGMAAPRRRWAWAAGILAVSTGGIAGLAQLDPVEPPAIDVAISGRPVPAALVPAQPAEAFLAGLTKLQNTVDARAAEASDR